MLSFAVVVWRFAIARLRPAEGATFARGVGRRAESRIVERAARAEDQPIGSLVSCDSPLARSATIPSWLAIRDGREVDPSLHPAPEMHRCNRSTVEPPAVADGSFHQLRRAWDVPVLATV